MNHTPTTNPDATTLNINWREDWYLRELVVDAYWERESTEMAMGAIYGYLVGHGWSPNGDSFFDLADTILNELTDGAAS